MALDPRRIPFIGHDIYQAGQVYDIVSQPCAPDPWIAIRAFWAYTPQLVWSLVKPDWGDLTFTRGGRGHHRKGFRRLRMDGAMQAPAPKNPGVAMAMFSGYQVLQRIGWYMVVVDATTDFAINWTSMAYQWSGCRDGPQPTAYFETLGQTIGALTPDVWVAMTGDTYHHEWPLTASEGSIMVRENRPHTVHATVSGHTTDWLGANGGLTGARLVIQRSDGANISRPLGSGWSSGGVTNLVGAHRQWGGSAYDMLYSIQTMWGGGVAHIDHMKLEITLGESTGMEADP